MYLICGEALFDVFVGDRDDPASVELTARVGGSPFNVAVGMSRLGAECALLTGISDDLFGARLERVLELEGVDTQYLVRTGRRTTLSVVGLDAAGSPSYSFYGVGSADCSLMTDDLPELDSSVTGLHFGSYSIAVSPVADAFGALASRYADRFISLDPNIRPSVEPEMDIWRQRIDDLQKVATVIKVSDEDLSYLYPGTDPLEMIRRWDGPKLVVLTRGGDDVIAIRGEDKVQIKPPAVTVVDTVGAGDAFQASLLTGLSDADFDIEALSLNELSNLIEAATQAAAITCTKRGADLPSSAEMALHWKAKQ